VKAVSSFEFQVSSCTRRFVSGHDLGRAALQRRVAKPKRIVSGHDLGSAVCVRARLQSCRTKTEKPRALALAVVRRDRVQAAQRRHEIPHNATMTTETITARSMHNRVPLRGTEQDSPARSALIWRGVLGRRPFTNPEPALAGGTIGHDFSRAEGWPENEGALAPALNKN
jgi:hypothetical protein